MRETGRARDGAILHHMYTRMRVRAVTRKLPQTLPFCPKFGYSVTTTYKSVRRVNAAAVHDAYSGNSYENNVSMGEKRSPAISPTGVRRPCGASGWVAVSGGVNGLTCCVEFAVDDGEITIVREPGVIANNTPSTYCKNSDFPKKKKKKNLNTLKHAPGGVLCSVRVL